MLHSLADNNDLAPVLEEQRKTGTEERMGNYFRSMV